MGANALLTWGGAPFTQTSRRTFEVTLPAKKCLTFAILILRKCLVLVTMFDFGQTSRAVFGTQKMFGVRSGGQHGFCAPCGMFDGMFGENRSLSGR